MSSDVQMPAGLRPGPVVPLSRYSAGPVIMPGLPGKDGEDGKDAEGLSLDLTPEWVPIEANIGPDDPVWEYFGWQAFAFVLPVTVAVRRQVTISRLLSDSGRILSTLVLRADAPGTEVAHLPDYEPAASASISLAPGDYLLVCYSWSTGIGLVDVTALRQMAAALSDTGTSYRLSASPDGTLTPMVAGGAAELMSAEGVDTVASGSGAHAEGLSTAASGRHSHAEGRGTRATGQGAHAEGESTTASGTYSHAEGTLTTASAAYSHAEGISTTASGMYSHAEGGNTTASGFYSHAEGASTTAWRTSEHAHGGISIQRSRVPVNATAGTSRTLILPVTPARLSWIDATVTARTSDFGAVAVWQVHALVSAPSASPRRLVGTPTVTKLAGDAATDTWAVSASLPNDNLAIKCTAPSSVTWAAYSEITEGK